MKKPKPARTLSPFDCHRVWIKSHLHNLNVLERYLPKVEELVRKFQVAHTNLTVVIDTGSGCDCYNQLRLSLGNKPSLRIEGNVSKSNLSDFDFLVQSIRKLMKSSPPKISTITVLGFQIVGAEFDLSKVSP